MSVSTHVLDAALGRPAQDVPVSLHRLTATDSWVDVGAGRTDADGRYRFATPDGADVPTPTGVYRLVIATATYFSAARQQSFYPEITITFEVTDADAHQHVPLLLSPYAYTTYRGELRMGVTLGHNQYGKAETRVVRIYRDADPHEIVDYNVSVALSGDFADIHLTGDNANCLTTDATKNTVNAFAKEYGEEARQPESFGLALARHFVEDVEPVNRARVRLEMYPWRRLQYAGADHPHAFTRDGGFVRTATVTYEGGQSWVVSGVKDLVVLKTTDSEFHGFLEERYTTLTPSYDRVMATSMTAQWWHSSLEVDWASSYDAALAIMTDVFAGHHSLALQQTMYAMGEAVIEGDPSIAEIRFSLPNKHHFLVDLSPYKLDNLNEVFHADDRPYGLIEGTIRRDDAPEPGLAFDPGQGW